MNDLLRQAQQLGIKIYIDNGQVKITLPWPLESTPEPARVVLGELRRRQAEVLAHLDPRQAEYWQAVLTNAYFLRCPKRQPMREMQGILQKMQEMGAYLAREERNLRLEQGGMRWEDWNWHMAMILPKYAEQLDWLLKLSVMGYAREYVDLAAECPEEWISEVLGKHGARITSLRAELIGKERCFELPDGSRYYLVACKTGQGRTELTPEEAVIIAEAQDSGMLPPGPEGARAALKWVK